MEKNQKPRNPAAGQRRRATRGEHGQPDHRGGGGKDFAGAPDPMGAVVEDQRIRPDGETQIVQDRRVLGQQIVAQGNADAESRRPSPLARAERQSGHDRPGGGEAEMDGPMPTPSLPEAAAEEGAVVEEDDQGGGDHDFLGGHAEAAAGDGSGRPGRTETLARSATVGRKRFEFPERFGSVAERASVSSA